MEEGRRRAARAPAAELPRHELTLYVAGLSTVSSRALRAVKDVCEDVLTGRYELRVVDIHQHPDDARAAGIFAVPTLLRRTPLPRMQLVGASDRRRLVLGLGPKEE